MPGKRFVASLAALSALAAHPALAQDAASGKTAFAQCAACHSVDGSNGLGPSLKGVIGRKAGSFPGFRYSRAMKGSTAIWDDKLLDAYITEPQKLIPGNLMPFSGVADAQQRADLIAYLKSLN